MKSTAPKPSLIARLALAANSLIGLASLFAALAAIDLARMKPLPSFIVAASLFGIASLLLLWETIVIVRQSRTGTMPVAMSLERPLGWVSLATILVASLLLVAPFLGVVPD